MLRAVFPLLVLIVCHLGGGSFCAAQDNPIRSPIKPSKATTYYTEPVHPDGSVDFITAVNEAGVRRVPTSDNAVRYLLEISPPRPYLAESVKAEMLTVLGLRPSQLRSIPFVPLPEHLKETLQQARANLWTRDQHPELADWLEQNRAALAHFQTASESKGFFQPYVGCLDEESGISGIMLSQVFLLYELQDYGEALAARVMLNYASQQSDHGLQNLVVLYRWIELLANGDFIHDIALAAHMQKDAFQAVSVLIESSLLNRQQLSSLYLALSQHSQIVIDLPRLAVFQRIYMTDLLTRVASRRYEEISEYLTRSGAANRDPDTDIERLSWANVDSFGVRDWNSVAELLQEAMDSFEHALEQTSSTEREQQIAKCRQRWMMNPIAKEQFQRIAAGTASQADRAKVVNGLLLVQGFFEIDVMVNIEARIRMSRSVVMTALLAEAYRHRNGRLPESLEELAKQFSRPIPIDAFTDQPLRYEATDGGYRISSVGNNKLDIGITLPK